MFSPFGGFQNRFLEEIVLFVFKEVANVDSLYSLRWIATTYAAERQGSTNVANVLKATLV